MDRFFTFFATGCGTGYIPVAPGTMGAVVGVGLNWLLSPLPHYIFIPTVVTFVFFAVWVAGRACVLFGEKDPPKVNIDEIAGLLVTFVLHHFTWIGAIVGFILFRIFDIAKPFPVRWVERRLPGGWGVVLDDVVAGVYANVGLWIFLWLFTMIWSG